jgi:hypothetical protein
MSNEAIEERLDELEGRLDFFEEKEAPSPSVRWDVIAIMGIWIAAAIMCFSPAASGHFESIVGGAVGGTLIIVLLLD